MKSPVVQTASVSKSIARDIADVSAVTSEVSAGGNSQEQCFLFIESGGTAQRRNRGSLNVIGTRRHWTQTIPTYNIFFYNKPLKHFILYIIGAWE